MYYFSQRITYDLFQQRRLMGEKDGRINVRFKPVGLRSFIVRPHADDFHRPLRRIDLINQPVLDIDAARKCPGQIAHEFFVWRRILKRILREDVEKPLRLRPEIGRRDFPRVLLRLLREDDRPVHQPGLLDALLSGSAIPLRMESRIPGIETRCSVS